MTKFLSRISTNLAVIWIIPDEMNVDPGYDQKRFEKEDRKNRLQTLVTSHSEGHQGSLKIHQDARISRIDLSGGENFTYSAKSEQHGIYVMLISGEVAVGEHHLDRRDALGVWDAKSFDLRAETDSELLFIEVPMVF